MKLELISFKICPFVQRAVITLLHKNIPHEISYIDLASPPDWFQNMSPFGKTPVLNVDDQHVIFESAIIDEFLDDTSYIKLINLHHVLHEDFYNLSDGLEGSFFYHRIDTYVLQILKLEPYEVSTKEISSILYIFCS